MRSRKSSPGNDARALEGSGNVMTRALVRLGMGDIAIFLAIKQLWAKAVGTQVAHNAWPTHFFRNKLTVVAKTSTWHNELHFLRANIQRTLNEQLPEPWITQIRIVAARSEQKEMRAATQARDSSRAPIAARHHDDAAAAAQHISDEAVREAFSRVMALGLSRQADKTTNA